jgi:hypothetical protein
MSERPDPTEEARRRYEDAEKRTASAMEELVKRDAFGELLARATENILALTRIGNDAADHGHAAAARPRLLHGRAGARAHDRARVGPDRQHLLDHRPDRQHRASQLRGREVRHVRADGHDGARGAQALAKAEKLHENGLNVTVNAVAPGFIATDMLEGVPEKVLDSVKQQIPFARLGRPEKIARVVHFLCADASSYITGQVWAVNGGMDM